MPGLPARALRFFRRHLDRRDDRPLLGLEVRVVRFYLRQPRHLEAMPCKFRKHRDQTGKGVADGEFGDAVLLQRLRDLPDLVVPDGLAEVYPVVARRDAVAVCPEQCRVDPHKH